MTSDTGTLTCKQILTGERDRLRPENPFHVPRKRAARRVDRKQPRTSKTSKTSNRFVLGIHARQWAELFPAAKSPSTTAQGVVNEIQSRRSKRRTIASLFLFCFPGFPEFGDQFHRFIRVNSKYHFSNGCKHITQEPEETAARAPGLPRSIPPRATGRSR